MKTPGDRLRHIRELLNLPIFAMSKRHGLSRHQLYNWESGRVKITQDVLHEYIPCLAKEGVDVDLLWILEGIGSEPIIKDQSMVKEFSTDYPIIKGEIPESALMIKDVSNFTSNHENSICVFVESNYMIPFYNQGDYVCGILVFNLEQLKDLVGLNCIILTQGNSPIVRKIKSINENRSFNLIGEHEIEESKIDNVIIDSAAEIILYRKMIKRKN